MKAAALPAAAKGRLQHPRDFVAEAELSVRVADRAVVFRRRGLPPDENHDVHHALDFGAVGKDCPPPELDVVVREPLVAVEALDRKSVV